MKYNLSATVHFRWMVLPVLAHVFSWMTGTLGIVLFPILLTVAHYLVFKIHPAVSRPAAWFFTLPVTYFIWVKWGPAIVSTHPNGIQWGIIAFYISQFINTLFIPLIIREEQPELLLKWLTVNTVSLIAWIGLYSIFLKIVPTWHGLIVSNNLALLIVYPAFGLLTNWLSGFFWKASLMNSDE